MRTEEEKINGSCRSSFSDDSFGGIGADSTPMTPSNLLSPPTRANYIEHRVSKMDTLAGVAIKYGVEWYQLRKGIDLDMLAFNYNQYYAIVADIKRLNGLVTDLQMFAHKSLQIPLPGRHPPSPTLSNGSVSPGECSNGHKRNLHPRVDLLDSFQSLRLKSSPQPRRVSPAMSSLQGYYGLSPSSNKTMPEGTEMSVYRAHRDGYLEHDSPQKTIPAFTLPPSQQKSKSLSNGHLPENDKMTTEDVRVADAGDGEAERSSEKAVRRRQKADIDSITRSLELISKDDSSSGSFFGIGARRPAPRPKPASRTGTLADAESGGLNAALLGDTLVADGFASVRKSSSTSNLQDSNDSSSSIWTTSKWNLKPDLQAISAAAIARPIFDGLPKPITGWRNKAALD
ncbi:hypothetical protein ACLOJK_014371 [Asimina triloba]